MREGAVKEKIKTYKGTDKDMKCRGFQYEVGKEYEEQGPIEACKNGFHACENPMDVFGYYPPNTSRYFETEQSGKLSRDSDESKVASSHIKIGTEIGLKGIIEAGVKFTMEKNTFSDESVTTGDRAGAQATGDRAGAQATGYQAGATAIGHESSAFADGPEAVACAIGKDCKAKGTTGALLVLVERGDFDREGYPIIGVKTCRVGKGKIKPDTWYALRNGKIVEVE